MSDRRKQPSLALQILEVLGQAEYDADVKTMMDTLGRCVCGSLVGETHNLDCPLRAPWWS